MAETNVIRRGIYNVDYFSGSQVSIYIGDIWVDEITTLSYGVMQNRSPIYGYASDLFSDVSEGHVLVQGQFTINFKEAGYLWLILNRYAGLDGRIGKMEQSKPFLNSASVQRESVERLVNNETGISERNQLLRDLAKDISEARSDLKDNVDGAEEYLRELRRGTANVASRSNLETSSSLGGFSSTTRAEGKTTGRAENLYEAFEDAIWQVDPDSLFTENRRTDDPDLNPFDIYVTFGDFAGDNRVNHTIEKIEGVHILGKSKQIVADGMPIQESYSFLAKNLI